MMRVGQVVNVYEYPNGRQSIGAPFDSAEHATRIWERGRSFQPAMKRVAILRLKELKK